MSVIHSSRGDASTRRRSDLRFAGLISAGMIATVLTLGALVAPLLSWNGSGGPNARERSQTVRLSEPAVRSTVRSAGPTPVDRPHLVTPAAAARLAVPV